MGTLFLLANHNKEEWVQLKQGQKMGEWILQDLDRLPFYLMFYDWYGDYVVFVSETSQEDVYYFIKKNWKDVTEEKIGYYRSFYEKSD